MILEIDAGNTRIKWRWLGGGGESVSRGAEFYRDRDLQDCWKTMAAGGAAPREVRVASVSARAVRDSLIGFCLKLWGVMPRFARVSGYAAGVTNGYADPFRLGVDRWLVLLAARQRLPQQHCLVVDCGSANTVDVLGADGLHRGGYIVPGMAMMLRSLFDDTAAVKVEAVADVETLSPGANTIAAVNRGIRLVVLGFVQQALREAAQRLAVPESRIEVLLTGGDSYWLPAAGVDGIVVEDLVLDGLTVCAYEGDSSEIPGESV